MDIDKSRCVGCGNCIPWCTMGVISIGADRKAEVNADECVECSNCYRSLRSEGLNPTFVRAVRRLLAMVHLAYRGPLDVCPTGALKPPSLKWPRFVRRAFSDPEAPRTSAQFDSGDTGAPFAAFGGRGTGEIKNNDVTGRLRRGDVGFVIELGRPGLGARLTEFQKVTRSLAPLGVLFEPQNPLTLLITDTATGAMEASVLDEKVLSAIIEVRANEAQVAAVLKALKDVEPGLNTVMSVGIAARCAADGSIPYEDAVKESGLRLSPNGKCNVGLGRPLFQEAAA